MPALFRPFINVVGREFEAKGFCFVLGVERTGRVNPVAYRDLRNPFAGLCIKSGRRNHDPAFVKLELIDELVNGYQPYAIVVEDYAGKAPVASGSPG